MNPADTEPRATRPRPRTVVTWWHPSVTDYRAALFEGMARDHELHLVLLQRGAGRLPEGLDVHVGQAGASIGTGPRHLIWRDLVALCRRIAVSDVFLSSFSGNAYTIAGLVWARLHGVPVVVWEEVQGLPRNGRHARWRRALLRSVARRVDAWFVMGAPQCAALRELGVAPERVFRSAEAPAQRYATVTMRALPLPFAAPRPLVLYLGRLIPIKGVDVLIDAFARLREQRPDAVLAIAGDGAERARLAAQAHALGLHDVAFLGHVGDDAHKAWLLRRASVLAVSSVPIGDWREGGPLVIPEALSAGTPVVCTDACGNTVDHVRSTGCGEVVASRDAPALAQALARWLDARLDRDSVCRRAATLPDHRHQVDMLARALRYAMDSPATAGSKHTDRRNHLPDPPPTRKDASP